MPLGFSIIYNTVVTKDTPNMKSKIEKYKIIIIIIIRKPHYTFI